MKSTHIFSIRFTPADPARGVAFKGMEQLYPVVLDSFVFDPQP